MYGKYFSTDFALTQKNANKLLKALLYPQKLYLQRKAHEKEVQGKHTKHTNDFYDRKYMWPELTTDRLFILFS